MFTEQLSKLEKPEEFADWLWEGLAEHYLGTDKSPLKRNELYNLFLGSGREYPMEVMNRIYHSDVPEKSKYSFRQGIGIALHKCTEIADKKVFDVATDLVYLISMTKAVEALDGLLEVNSHEFIAKNHDRILYDTVAIVQGLNPDSKVFDFTHNLVNSPFFDDGYIFAAMETMLDCKPDDCLKIVDEFKGRIQELYGAVHGIKDEESAYWDSVSKTFAKYPEVRDMIKDLSKA